MRNQFIFIAIFIGTLYSQCDSYILSECDSNSNCEWIEDTSYASCSSLGTGNSSFCDAQANCSYSWLTYSCGGGTYEVDNSYCEEIEVLECSDLGHGLCMNDEACEWVEEMETGNCSDINNGSECYATNQCSWYNAGNYGYLYDNCYGGTYTYDNSYCAEVAFQLGDINDDSLINILDVIEIVNLILESEYSQVADMNYDGNLNVLDIVIIVDIILGN